MGEALYRKYRPKSLSDVVGQPHITQTLENALRDGRISHAYLFTGPRGVGKTSVARILAHEVNGFEYADSSGSLDIIEIDAASNRRIDEIRELRDKVHTAPVKGKYKVYIIDEVHMLTREAFNALLKTLEEPPAHVIFILATTEVHKLPETIVSRTQRFTFKAVDRSEAVAHLKELATQENITISDEALALIAEHGEGSFRDSISLLDQLSIAGNVDESSVRHLIGLPPETTTSALLTATKEADIKKLIELLEEATIQGYTASHIGRALAQHIRQELIEGNELFGTQTLDILEKLLKIPAMPQPHQYLELVLVGAALSQKQTKPVQEKVTPKRTEPEPVAPVKKQPAIVAKEKKIEKVEEVTPSKPKGSLISHEKLVEQLRDGLWDQVLSIVKKKYNTLYGVARMGTPSADGSTLVLSVTFPFHKKRLTEPKNHEIFLATLEEVAGQPILFKCEVIEKTAAATEDTVEDEKPDTLQAVNDIFGGGEVLE